MKTNYEGQRYTKNDEILSKYILELGLKNKPMPYMTEISKLTGVSAPTISRYAKRRGYYSFASMRESFNKKIDDSRFNDGGIIDYIISSKRIVIVCSEFTKIIGEHIKLRFDRMGLKSIIYKPDVEVNEGDTIIAFSISGFSKKVIDCLESIKNKNVIFVTRRTIKNTDYKMVQLSKTAYADTGLSTDFSSIRRLFIWMDNILNIIQIKLKK